MAHDYRETRRDIPVMIDEIQHVMAKAEVFRTPDKVLIQITADGMNSQILADFLELDEVVVLRFGPLPS